jgi:DNA uptake protein ComE-like DNA-binding protein
MMQRLNLPRVLAAVLIASAVSTAAACGGGSKAATSSSSASASAAAATTTTTITTTTGGGTSSSAATTSGKVNANTASVGELQAAFEAVGISNAKRWAQEVDEYRPYANDPSFPKLREELSKYNISPDALAKIISVLEL